MAVSQGVLETLGKSTGRLIRVQDISKLEARTFTGKVISVSLQGNICSVQYKTAGGDNRSFAFSTDYANTSITSKELHLTVPYAGNLTIQLQL